MKNDEINVKDIDLSNLFERTEFIDYICRNIAVFIENLKFTNEDHIINIQNINTKYEVMKGIIPQVLINIPTQKVEYPEKNIYKILCNNKKNYTWNNPDELLFAIDNILLIEINSKETIAELDDKFQKVGELKKCSLNLTDNLSKIINMCNYSIINNIIQDFFQNLINLCYKNEKEIVGINAINKNLKYFPEISVFENLLFLNCSDNQIKNLNLGEIKIDKLCCMNNPIKFISANHINEILLNNYANNINVEFYDSNRNFDINLANMNILNQNLKENEIHDKQQIIDYNKYLIKPEKIQSYIDIINKNKEVKLLSAGNQRTL